VLTFVGASFASIGEARAQTTYGVAIVSARCRVRALKMAAGRPTLHVVHGAKRLLRRGAHALQRSNESLSRQHTR
jgi:hypothetical protein